MAWIDCWERQPDKDGEYMVQTKFDHDRPMLYSTIGGWNTYIDSKGDLHDDKAIRETHVLRWYEMETPPEIPEWVREAQKYKTWKEFDDAF